MAFRVTSWWPARRGPYWEPRDIWAGIYWNLERRSRMWRLDVYICVVPLFPIQLTWRGLV